MRYHNITKDDMLNGDGLRVVLWVAGCAHACPGCHNPVTWDPEGGLPFDEAARREIYEELEKDGFLYTVPGKGCYVAPRNVELLREENLKKIEEHIDEALRLALEAGLTKEELLETVTFALEEQL